MLNALGFEWEVPPGSRPAVPKKPKATQQKKISPLHDEWLQRFDQLKKYKEEFGNCIVPDNEKEYADLFVWVSQQRQERDKLSHDLKRKLDEIGKARVVLICHTHDISVNSCGVGFRRRFLYCRL